MAPTSISTKTRNPWEVSFRRSCRGAGACHLSPCLLDTPFPSTVVVGPRVLLVDRLMVADSFNLRLLKYFLRRRREGGNWVGTTAAERVGEEARRLAAVHSYLFMCYVRWLQVLGGT